MTKYYPKNFRQQMRRSSLYKQKTKDKNWFNNIKCLIIIIISKQKKDYKATFKESKA
jgi:endonuclease III